MPLYIRYLSRRAVDASYLKNIAETSLALMHKKNVEVSLVFIGKKRMRDLNRKYRGRDKVTDILSFGNNDGKEKDVFVNPKDTFENIGEMFICTERAKDQARKRVHSLKKEVSILLIHGILHLMGYDHENDEDARIMDRKERKLLERLK